MDKQDIYSEIEMLINELETLEHDSELITPNIINFLEQKC